MQALNEKPLDGILGVEFKLLKSFGDDRGFFREIFRNTDPVFRDGTFAQWSHSCMQQNVVKAWHYHHIQYDWWYLPIGQTETAIIDNRPESPTFKRKLVFKMGETKRFGEDTHEVCVRIPPGVLHGCRALSDISHLFYITSETYNPGEEGRIPYNASEVDHEWGEPAIVVEKDRNYFTPTTTRALVA